MVCAGKVADDETVMAAFGTFKLNVFDAMTRIEEAVLTV